MHNYQKYVDFLKIEEEKVSKTDKVFIACVLFLQVLAMKLGITYRTINVWIFCIIWPIFTISLIIAVLLT